MTTNIWTRHSNKLAGGWKTVSFNVLDASDASAPPIAKPHGDNPLGRVIISPKGWLSAHMARPDRMSGPLPSGKSWQEGGNDEVAHVARGLSMYCGYLQLFEDGDGLYWQTRVEVSSDPSRMGGIEERRVRYWEEGGKQFMELRPQNAMVMEDGKRGRGVLVWQKFE